MNCCVQTSKPKKHITHPEFHFERHFQVIAGYNKCRYTKIPDAIKTKDSLIKRGNGYTMKEEKRPWDGNYSTPYGNLFVELKANSNKLEKHQHDNMVAINAINGTFYVLRFREATKTIKERYQVEQPENNVIYETGDIVELVKWTITETKRHIVAQYRSMVATNTLPPD